MKLPRFPHQLLYRFGFVAGACFFMGFLLFTLFFSVSRHSSSTKTNSVKKNSFVQSEGEARENSSS